MKKYVFISLLALMAVVLSSCERRDSLQKQTIDLIVNQSNWEFDNSANMFYCHFDVPAITEKVYNYGEFSVSREYNSGTKNAYQVALPETTYKMEQETDDAGNVTNTYYYQQHLDYAIGIGMVEVFCTISDFFYEGFTPESMLFRLQMTY